MLMSAHAHMLVLAFVQGNWPALGTYLRGMVSMSKPWNCPSSLRVWPVSG